MSVVKIWKSQNCGNKIYQHVFQVILPDLLHDGPFPKKRPLLYTTKEWVLWYY